MAIFKEIKAVEVSELSKILLMTRNTGLSPQSFIAALRLTECVQKELPFRDKLITAVAKEYDIRTVRLSGGIPEFDYKNHPREEEIREKIIAINSELVRIGPLNFMSEEELHSFTKDLPMKKIIEAAKFLMKE